jgi:hypothetical protein
MVSQESGHLGGFLGWGRLGTGLHLTERGLMILLLNVPGGGYGGKWSVCCRQRISPMRKG